MKPGHQQPEENHQVEEEDKFKNLKETFTANSIRINTRKQNEEQTRNSRTKFFDQP